MRILYVGARSGTSLHRFRALQRLGHEAVLLDPRHPALGGAITSRWTVHTGALAVSWLTSACLDQQLGNATYDLAIVDGGDLLGPAHIRRLRASCARVINYNADNPYVARDGRKWRLFLKSVPDYDIIVTPRRSSVGRAYAAGARNVLLVSFAADEVVHRPPPTGIKELRDVVFVGTWMPERGPFFEGLVKAGVPVQIFGPQWHKCTERAFLSPYLHQAYLEDEAYVATVASARIALALLSVGNEDLHTTRSLEIPAIGSLLCAERTSDHLALYEEDEEAIFWSSAEECAEQCLALLSDQGRIARIARAGHERALRNGHFNEPMLTRVIDAALSSPGP